MNQKVTSGFTIDELRQLLFFYRKFSSGETILKKLVPDEKGRPRDHERSKISHLFDRFNQLAESQIFHSKGKGGYLKPPPSPIFDEIALILSIYDSMFPATSTIRIRIGAGMTAWVDLLPQILAEFRADPDNADCLVEPVYGTPEELRAQSDVLDLIFLACDPAATERTDGISVESQNILETSERAATEGQDRVGVEGVEIAEPNGTASTVGRDGVIKRIELPLRLICPADWQIPVPFDWSCLSDKTLFLLDERRVPSVEMPAAIYEIPGIRLRRAGSLVIANAMAAAGDAASISPAASVSQSLRGRVQAIEYPEAKNMCFALVKPERRFNIRSAEAQRAVLRLIGLLEKTLESLVRSPNPKTVERDVLYVCRDPNRNWRWRRAKTSWTFAWDQRFSGVFEWRQPQGAGMPFTREEQRYRVSGYIEEHSGQPLHYSWTAHRTRSSHLPGEQFVASHVVNQANALEQDYFVGTWLGRELIDPPGHTEQHATSSMGYLILGATDKMRLLKPEVANDLAKSYSEQNGLVPLILPDIVE